MFVGVVALRYQHHTTCHNSHKHIQSHLTTVSHAKVFLLLNGKVPVVLYLLFVLHFTGEGNYYM